MKCPLCDTEAMATERNRVLNKLTTIFVCRNKGCSNYLNEVGKTETEVEAAVEEDTNINSTNERNVE